MDEMRLIEDVIFATDGVAMLTLTVRSNALITEIAVSSSKHHDSSR